MAIGAKWSFPYSKLGLIHKFIYWELLKRSSSCWYLNTKLCYTNSYHNLNAFFLPRVWTETLIFNPRRRESFCQRWALYCQRQTFILHSQRDEFEKIIHLQRGIPMLELESMFHWKVCRFSELGWKASQRNLRFILFLKNIIEHTGRPTELLNRIL